MMTLIDKEKLLKNLSGMFNVKTIEKIKKIIGHTPSVSVDTLESVTFSVDGNKHQVKTNE